MEVIKNFTKRSMVRNQKRTIVTIIGVMLSAALMCAVAGMAATFRDGMINYYKSEYGTFYGKMSYIPVDELNLVIDNAHVVRAGMSMPVGTVSVEEAGAHYNRHFNEPYIEVRAFDDVALEDVSLDIVSGRLPENDTEIIINKRIMPVNWNVGDKITLDLGHRVLFGVDVDSEGYYYSPEYLKVDLGVSDNDDSESNSELSEQDKKADESTVTDGEIFAEQIKDKVSYDYTIVGVFEDPNELVQGYMTGGCVCITKMTDTDMYSAYRDTDVFTANVYFTLDSAKKYGEYTDALKEQLNKENKAAGNDREYMVSGEDFDGDYNGDTKRYVSDNMAALRPPIVTEKNDLIKFYGGIGDTAAAAVEAIAAVIIAIIVMTSIFVISNSFRISVAEKKIQFGMLSSIGATKRQIRKIVLREGFYIWAAGTTLGILLGVVVVAILTAVVQNLVGYILDVNFRFVFPWWVSVIVIVMSAVTIYFACIIPARAASKISPIEAIRGNNEVKLKGKKLKTSKITKKLFGIGGVVAAKNLKRSRRSYRTTVVSLVIGVATFIALSSFLDYGKKLTLMMYEDVQCDIVVNDMGSDDTSESVEAYNKICGLDGVKDYCMSWVASFEIPQDYIDKKVIDSYLEDAPDNETWYGSFLIYDRDSYARYLDKINVKTDDPSKTAILVDDYLLMQEDNSYDKCRYLNVHKGDTVPIKVYGEKDAKASRGLIDTGSVDTDDLLLDTNITITAISETRPVGLEGQNKYPEAFIIVSEDYFEQDILKYDVRLYINAEEPDKLYSSINDVLESDGLRSDFSVENNAEDREQMNSIILMVSIFLYGFIIVTTLIAVTNIFNTIYTNMNLRAKEFAMLKSVGMTGREFNRMVRLESIMYGAKSLFIGVPFGIVLSYAIYIALSKEIRLGYYVPMTSLVVAVVFVMLIVWMTMHISLSKIKSQNIIETIRKQTY